MIVRGLQQPAKILSASAIVFGSLSACMTTRYVGALASDLVWTHRGFGLVASLHELAPRWEIVDVERLEDLSPALRPQRLDDPVDLNGDGALAFSERTQHYDPELRLFARTATATIDLRVTIVPVGRGLTLSDYAKLELKRAGFDPALSQTSSTAAHEAVAIHVATPSRGARVVVLEQPDVLAEEGARRRQIVAVTLLAPTLRDEWVRDQEHLATKLLLLDETAAVTETERW